MKKLVFVTFLTLLASTSLAALAAFAGYYAVLDNNIHKTWREN